MVTLKIEAKTDSFEDAEILIKEALRSIRNGSQAGIIGGGIGSCVFDVDLSAAQQSTQADEWCGCEGYTPTMENGKCSACGKNAHR